MTELQMGLIGLGGVAVVGIFAYNKWQELRHRRLAEAALKPAQVDVLLDAEPVPKPVAVAPKQQAVERSEPALRDAAVNDSHDRREPILTAETPVDREDDDDVPLADVRAEPLPLPEETLPWTVEVPPVAPTPPSAPAPVFADPPAFVNPVPEAPPEVATPIAEHAPVAEAPGRSDLASDSIRPPLPPELLDPRLEFIVGMELEESVPASQILRSQRAALQKVSKPLHWIAFNERTRLWERLAIDSEQSVRSLRIALQLVNRLGPASDVDIAVFVGAMQSLADELTVVADIPSTRVRDTALELDRFCAAVDLEIGVNLVSRGAPFAGTKIRALAEAAGMVLGGDGLFTRHDDDGHPLFCLQNLESIQFSPESIRSMTTQGLTFLLDVPRVAQGERVFAQMTDLAKRFGETLQGTLVDDNRQPLSEAQLEHIRREFVGKPQATMAAQGLPAGSPQALRLFS